VDVWGSGSRFEWVQFVNIWCGEILRKLSTYEIVDQIQLKFHHISALCLKYAVKKQKRTVRSSGVFIKHFGRQNITRLSLRF